MFAQDALGAADGVGGWSHTSHASSANSALFSRRLMHNCSAEIALLHRQATSSSSHASSSSSVNGRTALLSSDLNPIDVLQRAYEKTMQSHTKEGLLGSSTALLAILTSAPPSSSSSSSSSSNPSTEEGTPSQPTLLLKIAHLGDSSLLLLSPSPSTASPSITFSTTPLLHAFNYPYQLGPRSKSSPINDAKGYEVEVKEGDLVVVSSDGMGDNLWEEEVLEEVRMWVGGGGKERETNMEEGIYDPPTSPSPSRRTTKLHLLPRFLSQALAQKARVASEDLSTDVPFGMRARENGIRYSGGKEDDITVLVAVVSRSKLEIRTGS
jgi:protein phosphatase PTC7